MPPKYTPTANDEIPSGLCECGCGQPTKLVRGTDRKAGKFAGYPHRFLKGHDKRIHPKGELIPNGLCECGCGKPTPICTYTKTKTRHFKGYPTPYLRGHGAKGHGGPKHHLWRGGKVKRHGYILVRVQNHPYARHGYVPEHRLVMEAALGRYLTEVESVHHINGVRDDNRLENLQLRKRYHGYGQAFVCADCGSHNIIPVELD